MPDGSRRGRQRDAERSPRRAGTVRRLDEDARAVAGVLLAAAGAAVLQVDEDRERLCRMIVRLAALQVHDEAEAAGVVLVPRVVQALPRWVAGLVIGFIVPRRKPHTAPGAAGARTWRGWGPGQFLRASARRQAPSTRRFYTAPAIRARPFELRGQPSAGAQPADRPWLRPTSIGREPTAGAPSEREATAGVPVSVALPPDPGSRAQRCPDSDDFAFPAGFGG